MDSVVTNSNDTIVIEIPSLEILAETNTISSPTVQEVTTVVVEVESSQTVIAGIQGPSGPPGSSEEDTVYSKRVDFTSDTVLYKAEAAVGSSESAAVWRIRKIVFGNDNDVTETWASGSANFDKVWADRLTYTYT